MSNNTGSEAFLIQASMVAKQPTLLLYLYIMDLVERKVKVFGDARQ